MQKHVKNKYTTELQPFRNSIKKPKNNNSTNKHLCREGARGSGDRGRARDSPCKLITSECYAELAITTNTSITINN